MACGSFAGNKVFVILGYGCGVRGLKVRDFSAGGLRPPWPRPEPSALDLRGSMSVSVTGAAAVPATASTPPPPGSEGPAGPPALMPNGRVASPPQVSAPVISTGCPAAPYGVRS